MRVLIADDHPIVRRGLSELLREEADVTHVGEAKDGLEVLQLVRKQKWDVLILDINMPGRDGLEVLVDLKTACPRLPVLILSMHPESSSRSRP